MKELAIHRIFIVSLALKGINSLLEIGGGLLFLLSGGVTSLLTFLIHGELIEDPTDFLATQVQHILPYFSTHVQYYAAFYLLSHGIIKIVLVICLIKNKLWAYPATIVALSLFILYQLYRLSSGFSLVLVLLTLFDLLIIYLTWHEYTIVKNRSVTSKIIE